MASSTKYQTLDYKYLKYKHKCLKTVLEYKYKYHVLLHRITGLLGCTVETTYKANKCCVQCIMVINPQYH